MDTTIVCVRLTPAELGKLDTLADSRSAALRLLLGPAGSELFAGDRSLPVLWHRLVGDVEQFARRNPTARPPSLRRCIEAIHAENYPAAQAAYDRLMAEYEPPVVWDAG